MSRADGEKADLTAWLAVAAGTIGSFMATLDTTMVNASLPTIQGEIGANQSEGAWISTGYLVAEIVMIPLAGWFNEIVGLRTFLLICTVAFTAFSVSCGLSQNLAEMVIGRIGQGFTGGAMVPTALTIVATRLPPAQRSIGIALFGFTAVMGPVLGPLLGGWLTEHISWRYSFYINVPFGAGLLILLLVGLPSRAVEWSVLRNADVMGIIGLALGLGAMTTVLEEGQTDRWFESSFIIALCAVSVVGFAILAIGQLTARRPVIRLSILFQRAFGSVFVLSMVVGAGLYGINYMLPQFLSSLAGYNAEQSGQVGLISGIPTVLLMLVFPVMVRLIDIRIAIGLGLFIFALSCLVDSALTTDDAGVDFILSQVLLGFAIFFSLMFLNQAATSAVGQDLAEDASGLFNAGRNLGGSFGLAAITTLRERRTRFHSERLAEAIGGNAPRAQDYLHGSALNLGHGDAVLGMRRALAVLNEALQSAGLALAFSDIFFVFGIGLLLSIPLVGLLKPLPKDPKASIG